MSTDAELGRPMNVGPPLPPREIAAGVHWLGGCFRALTAGPEVHYHVSTFLVVGETHAVLVDTGDPGHWDTLAGQIQGVLAGRPLDYVFPTHPELPHAGNLRGLVELYPEVQIVGDVRDYHVYYPDITGHLVTRVAGEHLNLGGRELRFVPALVLDLPNSLWAYDTGGKALFVSDGFAYIHGAPLEGAHEDMPAHRPGHCHLTSAELVDGPTAQQAAYGTARGLYWTRFVDLTSIFDDLEAMIRELDVAVVGPAHGNAITDIERILPIMREAHGLAYEGR